MLAWGEATGTDIVCALITDVAICHHNQCARPPNSGEGLRLIQIIHCAAVWAIPRENDRFKDFLYLYPLLGQISTHLEDQQYTALFRMTKRRVADLWR